MSNTIAAGIALAAALTLGSCDYFDGTHEAHEAIRKLVPDPDSAVFRNDKPGIARGIVCGEVNSKTHAGMYLGFLPYVYAGRIKGVYSGQPDFGALYRSVDGSQLALDIETFRIQKACQFAAATALFCKDPAQLAAEANARRQCKLFGSAKPEDRAALKAEVGARPGLP